MCVSGVSYDCRLPPDMIPFVTYLPEPEKPPEKQEEKPPQTVIYPPRIDLLFPSFVAFNMDIYFHDWDGVKKILPASEPIWLGWKYFPNKNACPQIQSVTTNPYVNTELRQIKYDQPCYYGRNGIQDAQPRFLSVLQLAFINQRWILAVHEVDFPLLGYHPTKEDLKNAYNNRKERLVNFYDSQLSGLDIVYGGESETKNVLVSLHVSHADILLSSRDGISYPLYTVQPTSNSAYAMFIHTRSGE
ncbi:hypothetical protein Hydth_0888 [Hydrogenobacter thermophilus TK-6]|uniref:Uncharacterized protein n=1 Tax=Hydrogenobacter thermophilus (strain DSM 6534 / IAM 12695 / TK-6) TaxID=608538 RepID=D3DHP5_HYDTT|nr:hypothetical protein [Hydrogenobacter thermophilus]ADO45284.1 hypothetical protein Hydth_0888 [Hydrogenobacter thermophilus TK-6]BAI69347.1 hypothetical protein HTH_0888 [Hydrogenobacter thermophilus TK-6]